MHTMKPTSRGFTLTELIVAMVVATILVAIAVPGYTNYVRKARRTEAKTAVLDLASLEERFFSTSNSYSSNLSDLGFASTASGAGPQSVDRRECQEWAASQAGAAQTADYRRAMVACVEGRGYAAK